MVRTGKEARHLKGLPSVKLCMLVDSSWALDMQLKRIRPHIRHGRVQPAVLFLLDNLTVLGILEVPKLTVNGDT